MADRDDRQSSAQVWGAVVVVASALAVVAAYLINGAALVLAVAGVEVLLVMVHVGRRWRAMHREPAPRGHRSSAASPDAAHCERCRRAREALDARQARGGAARPVVAPRSQAQAGPAPWSGPAPVPGPDAEPHAGAGPDVGPVDRPPYPRRPQGRAPYERPWTAERAVTRSVDRTAARRGAPGSAGRAVRHQ
ncbi:hypothetical protein ACIRS1_28380 [Kitasatospora sp. NPDC101176]|uniref:hypothetical protein n=1 Tax=Kitasatospora sp. NPDC101176 TaxID=3364099 RepID=UPI0037F63727